MDVTKECLPALSNPSPPAKRAPVGACDCHAHVIEPQSVLPFVANRDYSPPPAPLEAYQAMHRVLGIDRAVIVQPSFYGTDNSVTLRAIEAYGENCRGIAVVDDTISDRQLESLHAGGIRGVRYNLVFAGGVGLGSIERMAARIAPMGWHVQLLVNGNTLVDIEPVLFRLPVPSVIDHMGHIEAKLGLDQPGFQALLRLVRAGKAWVKLSGNYRISAQDAPYDDAIPFARALIAAAPHHMVWGTDWPHPAMFETMPDDGALLDALYSYSDADRIITDILVNNPKVLYQF
jgi:2-pyrone-4,6-dicarboxylate lactonase